MAIDVITEIVIERPRDQVAGYAADPSHAPEWYANIESVDWKTDPPVRVGSRMDFVAHFLGRRLAYTYEVVELVPGERLVMRTPQGGSIRDQDIPTNLPRLVRQPLMTPIGRRRATRVEMPKRWTTSTTSSTSL